MKSERGLRGSPVKPTYFPEPAAFRAWLEANATSAGELLVGFFKRGSKRPSMTWPESVDEALCTGWIDGVRRRVDEESYTIRFTPRRPRSIWSAVNISRVAELTKQGRMRPAGIAAFNKRTDARSGIYSYEQREAAMLDADAERKFAGAPGAWDFFQAQPPSYRRLAAHWALSAKRPETREKRLATLVADCAAGLRLKQFRHVSNSSATFGGS